MAAADPARVAVSEPGAPPAMRKRDHAGWVLAGWLILCLLTGGLGGLATAGNLQSWYSRLAKPAFVPPDWVFGPVWTVLYTAMAFAAWIVWKTRDSSCRRRGLRLFLVQLFLNLSWTYLFFAAHRPGLALAELALLAIAILLTAQAFLKMTRTAAALMLIYLTWVLYAGYLNWGIWHLNP